MPADPSILLCERCGYTIEGLPTVCSECGTPVAQSLPEARSGSPWQVRPRPVSLVVTNWRVLREPATLFSLVRLEFRSGLWLMALNLTAAATLILAPWSGARLDDPVRRILDGQAGRLGIAALIVLAQVIGLAAILFALTLVEWAGIQFFARRRGARLCALAAWQVVAHASAGWVVAAACVLLSLALQFTLLLIPVLSPVTDFINRSRWGLIAFPALGAIIGLLIFETLVSIGVHRCRFANRPRPLA